MSNNTSDTSLVTVIIPTYNLAHYIVETIESVLMQTYDNMEVIIIDDGSQDHTDEALAPFMSQITYIYQENQGISKTYNRGIEMAKGDYICFLEADDYWITKDKIEKQVAILQADPSLDYVQAGWQEININDEIEFIARVWEKAPELTLDDWLTFAPIRTQSLMVTHQCLQNIGGFNPHYRYAMDTDLYFNIANHGYKGTWLREITTAYRIHPMSASHQKRVEQARETVTIFTHYISLDSTSPHIKDRRMVLLFSLHIYFVCTTTSNQYIEDATQFAKDAIPYFWINRDFDVYDLATYIADSISYTSHKFDSYSDMVIVLKTTYEIPDTLKLSSRLSIATDDLLHWWLCIWWRYYHAMTPENRDTDLYRHPNMFKPYGIAHYQAIPIDRIIYLARVSIFVTPLAFDDRTLPTIDLFWSEMTDIGILSPANQHRLIDLYFAIATRALYYGQPHYVKQAIKLAIQHTRFQNVTRWGYFGKSLMGYIARKLVS